jgi:hypothetical protein
MYNLNQIIYYIVCGELDTITTPYIYLKIRRHIYSSEVLVLLFLLGLLLAVCYLLTSYQHSKWGPCQLAFH